MKIYSYSKSWKSLQDKLIFFNPHTTFQIKVSNINQVSIKEARGAQRRRPTSSASPYMSTKAEGCASTSGTSSKGLNGAREGQQIRDCPEGEARYTQDQPPNITVNLSVFSAQAWKTAGSTIEGGKGQLSSSCSPLTEQQSNGRVGR